MKSAAQEIVEYEQGVEEALRRFYNRTDYEATTHYTPLDSVLSNEPASFDRLDEKELESKLGGYGVPTLSVALSKADMIHILHAFAETEKAVQGETVARLYDYFGADGPRPVSVLRRVFACGAHMGRSPFCDLTLREKGLLLNESHGTQHWLAKKICEDPLRKKGAHSWKGPGAKTLGSRKNYSRSQQGNTNRRKK